MLNIDQTAFTIFLVFQMNDYYKINNLIKITLKPNMKTVTLRKSLNNTRLTNIIRSFAKTINNKYDKDSIFIDRIVLILNNSQEFKLIENISINTKNNDEINTLRKLVESKFNLIISQNPNIGKESAYIMFLYN